MSKLKDKRLNVITAIILTILTVGVIGVCFIPNKVVVISGGKTYEPYYCGDRTKNNVAIMINVYEGSEIVEKMLGVLKEKGAKATFFIGGCWADDNQSTLIKILENGHEIGSHGYFHKDHSKMDEKSNREEMLLLENYIKKVTGYEVELFAPPSGAFSVTTLKVAENLGYKTIMWSKDTIDWRDKSAKMVYNRATKNISGGDFILMHPKEHTLEALPDILDYYKGQGLTAVTVSECIG
ncbi:MAG: polysaccharide deacetylase [Clostridiales bacterium]|nr:polysaccharide deacetylase [Clostridiales bacterium]